MKDKKEVIVKSSGGMELVVGTSSNLDSSCSRVWYC